MPRVVLLRLGAARRVEVVKVGRADLEGDRELLELAVCA